MFKKLIESLKPMQEKTIDEIFPCPRCGHNRMDKDPIRNALSRRVDVYICTTCGREEALLDLLKKKPLPLNKWAIVK